jgi:Fe2+ transport system protein FeoA
METPAAVATLDRLAIGSHATVTAVLGEGQVRRRLLEMGLCPGVDVEVLRHAPLGDPIELRVRGYLLSIRCEQARLVATSERTSARC